MRALIIDPFAGISGDMLLGALVDLGLSSEWLRELVRSLDLGAEVVVERADRSGIACGRVRFELPHEHAHRHLKDVLGIVEGSGADPEVRSTAGEVFRRLAEAEAEVHRLRSGFDAILVGARTARTDDPALTKYAGMIRRSVDRMMSMAHELLDYSRGVTSLDLRPARVDELFERVGLG